MATMAFEGPIVFSTVDANKQTQKLMFTQKSSHRISHKHRMICGRDEDSDLYRTVYQLRSRRPAGAGHQDAMLVLPALDPRRAQGLRRRLARFERFQFVDQPGDHAQAAVPEFRIAGVEAERRQQFGVMLGAAGRSIAR